MEEDDRVPFTLNFNRLLEMKCFRKGFSSDPFPREFMTSKDYARYYQSKMSDRIDGQRLRDFILDESGEIIPRKNSGNMLRKLSIFPRTFQHVLLNILGPSMEHSRIF